MTPAQLRAEYGELVLPENLAALLLFMRLLAFVEGVDAEDFTFVVRAGAENVRRDPTIAPRAIDHAKRGTLCLAHLAPHGKRKPWGELPSDRRVRLLVQAVIAQNLLKSPLDFIPAR